MEEKQELIMNVGEKEEEDGGKPSSWNCDQTEGPKPEPEIEEHRIDVKISDRVTDWIGSVGKAKEGSTPSQTPWPTIPKVPHLLRETKDFNKFFEPRVISIHLNLFSRSDSIFAVCFSIRNLDMPGDEISRPIHVIFYGDNFA